MVTNWTEHAGIVKWTAGQTSVKNVLAVEVGADTVAFFINGEKLASLSRAGLDTEGIVGLRVNHAVNIHVSKLSVDGAKPSGAGPI